VRLGGGDGGRGPARVRVRVGSWCHHRRVTLYFCCPHCRGADAFFTAKARPPRTPRARASYSEPRAVAAAMVAVAAVAAAGVANCDKSVDKMHSLSIFSGGRLRSLGMFHRSKPIGQTHEFLSSTPAHPHTTQSCETSSPHGCQQPTACSTTTYWAARNAVKAALSSRFAAGSHVLSASA
jgi:hypothetical protein